MGYGMTRLLHESRYRTDALLELMRRTSIAICGAGALGANIAESLVRSGCARITVIDRDRVEERNLSTQPYHRSDIGAQKGTILANTLYRAVGAGVTARNAELTPGNAGKLLHGADLVVETFDNSASRGAVAAWCAASDIPCVHAGLAGGYAEVIWNDIYRVPSPAGEDLCDYPLARNLVTLACSVACEAVIGFLATGERRSHTITLEDLAVRRFGL